MLGGIEILDLTQGVAGPFCTQLLADMGARVTKVEPVTGDITRGWGPPFVDEDRSAYFFSMNRNKRSIVLDLKKPLGRNAFDKLLGRSDVLVESFRPGVMARLGYSWKALRKARPKLVYCSITGYGQDGPSADEGAFDNIAQARSGLMNVTGEEGGVPMKMGVPITDIGTGMYAALAIATALFARSLTGKGSRVDASLLDSAVSWLCYWLTGYSVTGTELPRIGNAHPTLAPYQAFETKEGSVALGVGSDRLWERFAKSVGGAELLGDSRFKTNKGRVEHRKELTGKVGGILGRLTTEDLARRMKKAGVPFSPVRSISDVIKDPQVVHRKMILDIDGVSVPGFPIKFDSLKSQRKRPAPKLGTDTKQVLSELGWSEGKTMRLIRENSESASTTSTREESGRRSCRTGLRAPC